MADQELYTQLILTLLNKGCTPNQAIIVANGLFFHITGDKYEHDHTELSYKLNTDEFIME